MKGVWNKIARVDLTSGSCTIETLPEKVLEQFIGGAGLGAYILYKEVPAGVMSADPENRIIFATGPFNGIRQTGAAKWSIVSKSPSLEANATSCITNSWGYALKSAGVDALVVQGKASKPAMIVIDDDTIRVESAMEVWGKDSYETDDLLKDQFGKEFEVACIGPSGEKQLKYAAVVTGKCSFAGRGGMGGVMGSKNLKAVVVRGSKECPVADPEKLDALNKEINVKIYNTDKAKPANFNIRAHGTSIATGLFKGYGNMPLKNWQLGEFDSGIENLGAPNYGNELNTKPKPCKFCTLGCKNHAEVEDEKYGFVGEGPEYESFAMMGLNLMLDDMKAVAYGGHIANTYGIDTISLGACLAWAFESYEKGVLTKNETGGLELEWGNAEAMVELTKKVANREEGLGYILGEGVRTAAEYYGKGSEAWAVEIKNMEVPAHDPRASFVAGLNYLTGASCGPNHEKGNPQHMFVAHILLPEFGISDDIDFEKERHSWENAPRYTAAFQNYSNLVDSLVHCKFMVFSGYTLTDMLNTFNAVTGLEWDFETFEKAGERIFTVQKLLNLRYGITAADETKFPERLMQAKEEGPYAGVSPVGIEDAVLDYYRHRGWDETGMPLPEKISEMDLEDLV